MRELVGKVAWVMAAFDPFDNLKDDLEKLQRFSQNIAASQRRARVTSTCFSRLIAAVQELSTLTTAKEFAGVLVNILEVINDPDAHAVFKPRLGGSDDVLEQLREIAGGET